VRGLRAFGLYQLSAVERRVRLVDNLTQEDAIPPASNALRLATLSVAAMLELLIARI
jgi:hypothetical protein